MARRWASPRRVPLSARAIRSSADWPVVHRKPHSARRFIAAAANDSSDISDDSGEEEPAALEECVTDRRIVARILRSTGLRGLVTGPMGAGLVTSRIAGFGKGVSPSTRIENCVAVALNEADVRTEGGRFFVLTAAHDGFNLTWVPSVSAREGLRQADQAPDGWLQVALLPFRSVFSKHEGLAAAATNRARRAGPAADDLPPLQTPPDALLEELKQLGLDGLRALIFVLAKIYQTPDNAFQAMSPEHAQATALDLENLCRRQLGYDVESLTGVKPLLLFAELDVRSNGFITVEDLGCSSSSPEKSLPCSCAAVGHACISQVWKLGSGSEGDIRRMSNYSSALSSGMKSKKGAKVAAPGLRRLERPRAGTASGSDDGSRTTRREAHRQNDAIRKERENREMQDTHLDLERERFITTVQRTTVLHPLDYNVTRRMFEEMESKHRLVQRLSAEAEAAFAKSRGKVVEEEGDEARVPLPDTQINEPKEAEKSQMPKKSSPNTPRALLEMSRSRGGRANNPVKPVQKEADIESTSSKPLPQARKLALAREQAARQPSPVRTRVEIATLVVDALRPRGFDASRRVGDVATALYLPSRRLLDDGALAVETVLAGFESGRVAIFKTFFPEDFVTESSDKTMTLEEVMEEREGIKSLANGEPVLQAQEPLLLEHYHCDSPVVALFWHQIMGIFSISTNGRVVVADSCGVKTFSISEACGRNATATSADMSTQLEQLAVAGQRGIHLWQTLSQAKYGVVGTVQDGADVNPEQNNNFMLVRYMPTGKFLLTLSQDKGDVKLWDARSLELHCSLRPGESSVDCAFWEPRWETLLMFTASGVTEIELREQPTNQDELELAGPSRQIRTANVHKQLRALYGDSETWSVWQCCQWGAQEWHDAFQDRGPGSSEGRPAWRRRRSVEAEPPCYCFPGPSGKNCVTSGPQLPAAFAAATFLAFACARWLPSSPR
ncbi:unnamed protein product [Symbiodinium necroappetens]|uniref:Uncharacterized protein n=1 Tax=Symbiodinium necroappetens TaxID=1628268 RepID=A0A812JU15_9DINO|nr:unnamed protein product [Symbiodinium necroappetens]